MGLTGWFKSTAPTINTSNSSKHLNGASIASQSAIIKDTVEKDLSPPESDFVLFVPSLDV